MSILLYIFIAIAATVLIIGALFYLIKGILTLVYWFMRLLPTIIKAAIYWALVIAVYSILKNRYSFPTLPTIVYPLLYFLIIGIILVRRFVHYGSIFKTSDGLGLALLLGGIAATSTKSDSDYKGYVLNKKSKVIHEKYSDSEKSISSHHRKEVSYSEARELMDRNEKYRFKK